jgi:hypothetical protein
MIESIASAPVNAVLARWLPRTADAAARKRWVTERMGRDRTVSFIGSG